MNQPFVDGYATDKDAKVVNLPSLSLGALLIDAGKITSEGRDRILNAQATSGQRFGQVAKTLGLLKDSDIQEALSRQFGFAYAALNNSGLDTALVVAHEPFGTKSEAIRTIRSHLQLRWFGTGHKLLAIVTHEIDIGSQLLGNLAIVFAQLKARTLVIDANLRDPRQHRLFNLQRHAGLAELLAGRAGHSVIAPISGFDSLSVIPAGAVPPNPQELLSGMGFATMLNSLSAEYDVILIDTPPLSRNVDACLIGAAAGAALVTARRNVSRVRDIKTVNAALATAGVSVIGAVLAEG